MSFIFILLIITGTALICFGITYKRDARLEDLYYCPELKYIGDLEQWRKYARTLTDSKPMQREINLMDDDTFKQEMNVVYGLTLTEIIK